eukprot:6155046-Prymnesium_polylepis.1
MGHPRSMHVLLYEQLRAVARESRQDGVCRWLWIGRRVCEARSPIVAPRRRLQVLFGCRAGRCAHESE